MKKSCSITVFLVSISLAAAAWWVASNIALISTIISQPRNNAGANEPIAVDGPTGITTNYKPAHYLFFKGKDSFAIIPPSQNLNVHQFSILFWARNDGPKHNSYDRPIEMRHWSSKESNHSLYYGWAFDVGNISKIGSNRLRFTVGSTDGHLYVTDYASLPKNRWTHIAGVFDGINLMLYKNGVLISTFPFNGTYGFPVQPLPVRLASGFIPNHYWTGYLSDIQIYGDALLPSEIKSLFEGQGRAQVSKTLIGHWKLDEGKGVTIHDSSSNGSNGTISNAIWK